MFLLATLSAALSLPSVSAALAQEHGGLHSPEAEIVWRAPSLTALAQATAKSAAGQLLADPEFEAWVRRITGRADFKAPKTIPAAFGFAAGQQAGTEADLVTELLWGEGAQGVSLSIQSKGGSSLAAAAGVIDGRLAPAENFNAQWAIEFSGAGDRSAWLAAAKGRFESSPRSTLTAGEGRVGLYRWAVGEAGAPGEGAQLEGTIRFVGEKHAVIELGNPALKGAAAEAGPHPLFKAASAAGEVTAALDMVAPPTGSRPWDNQDTAPFEELLAACAGPIAETVFSLSGQLEWIGGDQSATLRSRGGKDSRKAVGLLPLSEKAFALAHPGAHVAIVTSFDETAFAESLRALGAGEKLAALLSAFNPEVGISILPMSRGILPQAIVTFDIGAALTPADALDALGAACNEIAEATRREVFFAKAEYRGATYFTPRFKNPGVLETLIQPCIVATEDRIFLASDAALAKREIRRLKPEVPRGVHASLAAMQVPETGVTLAACADWAGLVTDAHGRADGILKVLSPLGFGPMSADMLPTLEFLTRHLTPSHRWVAVTETGFVGEAQTPFGPPEFAVGGALMASWFIVQVDRQLGSAQIVAAKAEIVTIHNALQEFYLREHMWPDRLSALPLNKKDPRDPWGSSYKFAVDREGELLLWSIGPNRLDEKGKGDDITFQDAMGWPK